ncbi:nucleolar complex-associated protein-domain-containing protein [Collybia nuda]|uniref:Nucleolar complex-associated protein-domain-containing protein n=1 Tax=Collybia nuda TaxID=64659 RepID=A0A9P5YA70_9AGAR|nr:nucleolar complex-associated protein-domain-containing protein [Collybia nuda]
MAKQPRKRLAPPSLAPSKKRKLTSGSTGPQTHVNKKYIIKAKEKGKEKAADRGIIPIPEPDKDTDVDLSDQDLEVFQSYEGAVSFLNSFDHEGITRSKKETDRLHKLNKPIRQVPAFDDLPSVDSHSESGDPWDSGMDDEVPSGPGIDDLTHGYSGALSSDSESDTEMLYERIPRKRHPSWEPEKTSLVRRLPVKSADGRVHQTGEKFAPVTTDFSEGSESDEGPPVAEARTAREDVSTGARFGRPAVVDIVGNKSRHARIQGAKEQIAGICQEIVADPENSLGLLRRLHTFSLAEISSPTQPDPVPNDPLIRKLAILSQLAVFKDIIPGYRIRTLTDKEKAEKVSQMVARTRDWEQGLVIVYQNFLRSLEAELKGHTELGDVALRSMCTLLTEATHFNFRVNLIGSIIARLSKRSWDESSNLCLNTLIKVFREDMTGGVSLEVVRLLNRMVKERRFNVHPEVLTCLLHLRLKAELGVRASESKTDKEEPIKKQSSSKAAARRAKGKITNIPHLSKKAKKVLKEKREIEKEFREAEAEVDKEERAVAQTEALKLLFVLYFRIIKNPRPTPLLPAALHGISKFAHLVNIDFFKDLMKVLKNLITYDITEDDDVALDGEREPSASDVQHRLLCIVTAFELLSGQGEALNIDLTDFISRLYAIILPLSFMTDIDVLPESYMSSTVSRGNTHSVADMLFRALNIVFSPRTFGTTAPPWRSAAFAKRLLSASLHWPPAATLRTLDFVGGLIAKDNKLEALLSTEDRTFDGAFRPDIDDPQLCNPFGTSFWELHTLSENHWDANVRAEAGKLLNLVRA